ncbi:unnamed protein product, partial [Amoebophrya sp. A120]
LRIICTLSHLLLLCLLFLLHAGEAAEGKKPSAEIKYGNVKQVYVVMSSHFDEGYTDFAVPVLNRYFQEFFPAAVKTVELLKKRHPKTEHTRNPPRLVYTLDGPWLASMYLQDCAFLQKKGVIPGLSCPTEAEQYQFRQALKDG